MYYASASFHSTPPGLWARRSPQHGFLNHVAEQACVQFALLQPAAHVETAALLLREMVELAASDPSALNVDYFEEFCIISLDDVRARQEELNARQDELDGGGGGGAPEDVELAEHAAPQPGVKLEAPQPGAKLEAPQPGVKLEAPQPEVKLEAPQPEVKLEAPQPQPEVEFEAREGPAQGAPSEPPAAPRTDVKAGNKRAREP